MKKFMKAHFIGVGGIGMSALADVLIDQGVEVSGSDTRLNNLTKMLSSKGASIFEGHASSNVPRDADVVVKSTCIREDNPEVLEARFAGIEVISRGEMLKYVIERASVSIGVTGTHGKTTTSGLISYITDHCGMEPTVLVGGEMERFGKNSRLGRGDVVVAEVDESDGFFREIPLTHAIVTNVEREHMEHYGTMERLLEAYRSFIGKVASKGILAFNGDDATLRDLVKSAKSEKLSFGLSGKHDASCAIKEHRKKIEFEMFLKGRSVGTVRSPLIGLHNVANILGASALCVEMGMSPERVFEAVEMFKGVKRRFDTVGRVGGIRIVEDYAHHPTELRSVIKAAKDFSEGRVLAVFQPHRYSRTFDLEAEFSECFYGSDVFFLTDIYSADEDPLEGASVERLFGAIDKSRFEDIRLLKKDSIPEAISDLVKENDTILILGAGDIREISGVLLENIRKKMGVAAA